MTKNRFSKGEPALYKYQSIKYFHFDVPPGSPLALTSDPWSYLYSWLSQKIKKTRGDKKKCLQRAIYYSELANNFYKASDLTELPTKGTLAYYGMLNLVKCFISVKGVELEKTWEHHGITLLKDHSQKIEIKKPTSGVSIFCKFADILGTPVTTPVQETLKDICQHIPELHELLYDLGLLKAYGRRKFLPVNISFLVNEDKNKLFTEISYEKSHEARVETSKFYKGSRAEYFHTPYVEDCKVIYRSKKRKNLTKENCPTVYRNTINDYKKFSLVSLLTRSGYRYYCDLRPGTFHHLAYTLALMFYIGSVTRYRPSETEKLLNGAMRPIIGEAVKICPRQFLYQIVGLTTESICVVPHSDI
ncbi:YaaC family protein [Desulfopila inferna]|uniref:YaaC family protein n=1 Tax=Desulfopila inferna TaxID=468528 RepID=UPI001964E633|nr:YaaC family protein [Desulfopila inferna]MBM9605936.1 hypothetical protein [Desulfopila inferna]